MSLTAVEAAKLTGVSKAAILKAVKTGRVSASKDAKGTWQIDPAELMRVYTPVDHQVSAVPHTNGGESTEGLRREVAHLRELLASKDETIAELRRLTLLLEDKQQPRQPWWQRLLHGA